MPIDAHETRLRKAALRRTALRLRSAMTSAARTEGSRRAAEHLKPMLLQHGPPGAISGFLAIGDEIDPMPALEAARGLGFTLCLPVMVGRGKALVFRAWQPGDELISRQWGIREPRETAAVVEPDVLLVPLLAFDADGHRLGYGGGYFDRTLADLRSRKRVLAIGLAFDEQRIDSVPSLDYDEPLDGVLTPSGLLRCRPTTAP